jgi:hypothetical protein
VYLWRAEGGDFIRGGCANVTVSDALLVKQVSNGAPRLRSIVYKLLRCISDSVSLSFYQSIEREMVAAYCEGTYSHGLESIVRSRYDIYVNETTGEQAYDWIVLS